MNKVNPMLRFTQALKDREKGTNPVAGGDYGGNRDRVTPKYKAAPAGQVKLKSIRVIPKSKSKSCSCSSRMGAQDSAKGSTTKAGGGSTSTKAENAAQVAAWLGAIGGAMGLIDTIIKTATADAQPGDTVQVQAEGADGQIHTMEYVVPPQLPADGGEKKPEDTPWYKTTAGIVGIILGVLALLGAAYFLLKED